MLNVWRRIRTHPVLGATASYASLTTGVKAVAFLKESVVAAAFGVSGSMDVYLVALVIVGFPSGLLMNSVQTVFVRDYVRVSSAAGDAAAKEFLAAAVTWVLVAMSGILILWFAFLPQIVGVVGRGMPPDTQLRVTTATLQMTPYYFLYGTSLMGYGAIQARKGFVFGGVVPVITPVVIMAVALLFRGDVTALILALTCGTLLETVVVFARLDCQPIRVRLPNLKLHDDVRRLFGSTLLLMPGTLISGFAPMIEKAIASGLGSGAISALGYAAKLPATLNSVLVTAVGVTILPYFSELHARGEAAHARRFFVRYLWLLLVAGLALTIISMAISGPFVRLAFERGAFTARDTVEVTGLQQAYLLQLPGALIGMLALRLLAAQGRFRDLTLVSIFGVPASGLLQWWLASVYGSAGVALGTSAASAITAAGFTWLALRSGRRRTA